MFWGLIMEPGKKYSQTVEKSFHVSQAALDLDTAQTDCVQVLLGFESRNYLLCTLQKSKWVQSNLDLNFQAGDSVSFATNGPGHVHLTGYLVPEDDYDYMDEEEVDDEQVPTLVEMSSKKRKASEVIKKEKTEKPSKKSKTELLLEKYGEVDSDDSQDSDVNTDVLEDDSDVEEEEEAESEDGVEREESEDESEEEEQIQKPVKSPKKESPKQVMKSPKGESPKQNGVAKTPKSEKKQQKQAAEKTPKNDKQQKVDKTPKSAKVPKSPTIAAKQVEGGVIIEELKIGDGRVAKSGKYVTVFYEGRLKGNNKVFDSSGKESGFKFHVGKREVIKGWDVGVAGMKVGGKRRITCPPNMAYGAQGSPPVIPPNSTLVFDIELKKIA